MQKNVSSVHTVLTLNLIKHLWDELVFSSNISTDTLLNLVETLPKRLAAVAAAKGHIKYYKQDATVIYMLVKAFMQISVQI